jgi:tetratricopeptide (TPR) repeat protein
MNLKILAGLCATLLAAVGLLAPASQPNPAEAARLNNLGCAYMNQQLFEKALKAFQQAAQLDPKLTIARLNQGVAYLNLQKIDDAIAALEEARKEDPKSPNAWFSLGLLAKNTGDSQPAIDDFKRVTEIDPNDADTWYFLGTAYVQAKQFPLAIDAFQRALKINPLHASAEFGLSRAYQQSADVDHANLDHAREHLKKFQYITQNKIGAPMSLAYGEQGQYSRAVESPLAVLKPPPQIKVQFVDVTKEAGIVTNPVPAGPNIDNGFPSYLGSGACFLDYDNDGNIDVFLADDGARGAMALYHNLGNGKFEEVTNHIAGAIVEKFSPPHATGCTTGDYDNDGFADIAYSSAGSVKLMHNEQNGTFRWKSGWPFSRSAGIGSGAGQGTSQTGKSQEQAPPLEITKGTSSMPSVFYPAAPLGVSFIDYDHDGDLDVYITEPRPIDKAPEGVALEEDEMRSQNVLLRNNTDGTFTDVTDSADLQGGFRSIAAVGTDFNNDRAIDLLVTGGKTPKLYENPREGKFHDRSDLTSSMPGRTNGVAVLDFDHDGWMDYAFTHMGAPALTLWRNNHGKSFEQVKLPATNWVRAYGVAAFDYDNDGWVDLVAVGETKEGKGEIKLFRNLGPDGWKDVTTDVGLDKIHLESPRAIITGDYDNDGAVDLLITQNHGPAVLLRNVVLPNPGGNQNHWLRLALKGLNDNKSAIGTKVEVFSGGNRQKFEIYGSNGYLGQNSPYLTVGLGGAKEADIVRMLWPTGVLQDEIQVAGDRQQDFLEIDRRGSSCPTLFVWNGERYEFVADMLGAGVVGHWVGPGQRDIPRPVEYVKIDRHMIREKENSHVSQNQRDMGHPIDGSIKNEGAPLLVDVAGSGNGATLSFRFMEPLEEAVYLDQVRLLAVDHPADVEVYPNEYFASNPPYPPFKVLVSRGAQPPSGAWDEHGHNVLPDLLAHRYFGDFALTQFLGFAQPHSLTLDLGEPYDGGPLWLLLHGEVEYFSANSMYAASQAGIEAIPPYVEALVENQKDAKGKWLRVVDDMGFPAGAPRTMTADLTGKLPKGTRKIRITTNLQIYWDSLLIDRTKQGTTSCPTAGSLRQAQGRLSTRAKNTLARNDSDNEEGCGDRAGTSRLTDVPLVRADLEFHGYPYKIEGTPPGNVQYIYEKASATGPYTRPAGTYTGYGDVLPLLTATDDKLAVFGSGDEVRLDFDPSSLPALPPGWVRDFFFAANGYEKDMDFYAAEGNYVAPLPFLSMGEYPYAPKKSFPLDDVHVNYLLEYNTRHMSGNEQRGYWFDYGEKK